MTSMLMAKMLTITSKSSPKIRCTWRDQDYVKHDLIKVLDIKQVHQETMQTMQTPERISALFLLSEPI